MSYLHDLGQQIRRGIDNSLGLAASGESQYEDSKKFAMQEAEKQRQFEREMTDLAYQRSTPAHQMELYRQSGLNPSLMYGQMSDLATDVPSGAEANAPSSSSGRLDSLLGLGADVAMKVPTIAADVDLKRAQAEEIRSRIPLNQERVNEVRTHVSDLLAGIDLKKSTAAYQDALKENISFEQMMKQANLSLDVNRFNLDYQRFGLEKLKNEADIKMINVEVRNILARAKVSERELAEMIDTYAIRKTGLIKQNSLMDAQIRQANETAEKLKKEGLRFDQVMALDAPAADRKNVIMSSLESDNVLENIGGLILYGVDYVANDLLSFIK